MDRCARTARRRSAAPLPAHLAGPRTMRRKMRRQAWGMPGPGVDPTALSSAVSATTFSCTPSFRISVCSCTRGSRGAGPWREDRGEEGEAGGGGGGGGCERRPGKATQRACHPYEMGACRCWSRPAVPTAAAPSRTCSAQWPCLAAAHSANSVLYVYASGCRPLLFILS